MKKTITLPVVVSALLGFTFISCWFFYWSGIDDDIITLWSGQMLGQDSWFINYNGKRSEMTSSVLAALVAKLAFIIAPQTSFLLNKILLFLFAPATIYLMWRYRRSYLSEHNADFMGLAAIVMAAITPFLLYWAQSGMETPLYVFIITAYVLTLIQYIQAPQSGKLAGLLIALQLLLVLVRAEGFWLIVVTLVMLWVVHNEKAFTLRMAKVYVLPAIGFLLLILIRHEQTGLYFPNPAYAKMGGGTLVYKLARYNMLRYYTFAAVNPIFFVTLVIAVLLCIKGYFSAERSQRFIQLIVLTGVIAGQEAFAIVSGGGWEFPSRILTVTSLLKICLLFHLLSWYGERWLPSILKPGIWVLIAAMAVSNVYASKWFIGVFGNPLTLPEAYREIKAHPIDKGALPSSDLDFMAMRLGTVHERDIRGIYDFLQNMEPWIKSMGEVRIVTGQAGIFPYFISKLYPGAPIRYLDIRGLMDADITQYASDKKASGVYFQSIQLVLGGKQRISNTVLNFNPNMFYDVEVTDTKTMTYQDPGDSMRKIGWEMVHYAPDASVWVKAEYAKGKAKGAVNQPSRKGKEKH